MSGKFCYSLPFSTCHPERKMHIFQRCCLWSEYAVLFRMDFRASWFFFLNFSVVENCLLFSGKKYSPSLGGHSSMRTHGRCLESETMLVAFLEMITTYQLWIDLWELARQRMRRKNEETDETEWTATWKRIEPSSNYKIRAMAQGWSVYRVVLQSRFMEPGRSSITEGCNWSIKKHSFNLGKVGGSRKAQFHRDWCETKPGRLWQKFIQDVMKIWMEVIEWG